MSGTKEYRVEVWTDIEAQSASHTQRLINDVAKDGWKLISAQRFGASGGVRGYLETFWERDKPQVHGPEDGDYV